MLDRIIELWNTKRVVFWVLAIVLVPLMLLLVFKNVAMAFLASKANEQVKEAELKDKVFKTAIDSLNVQAAQAKQKADDLGKQAKDVEVSEDWNKS